MGHEPVTDERLAALRPAQTTEADILKTFGKPTLRLNDGRTLAYAWTTTPSFYVTFFTVPVCFDPKPTNVSPVRNDHVQMHWLLLDFNDDRTLLKSSIRHGGMPTTTRPADPDRFSH